MVTINGYEIAGRMPIFTAAGRDLVRRGLKTQTRRVMKVQPEIVTAGWGYTGYSEAEFIWRDLEDVTCPQECIPYCPYGKVGDIRVLPEPLYREMFFQTDDEAAHYIAQYMDDSLFVRPQVEWRWKLDALSSMFMPIEFGRTLVQYNRIWAERLWDISDDNALAEGAKHCLPSAIRHKFDPKPIQGYRLGFKDLWDSINGKKHPWSSNPWVWAIEWELLK
jgi:hypothetical protein